MRKTIDLTGVDPLRREETLRRIAVVERYLAIPQPTRADSLHAALELDVAETRFFRMVRAWRATGTAAELPDATVRRKGPSRWLEPEVEDVVESRLDELGHLAPYVELAQAVSIACLSIGRNPPSESALRARIDRRMRQRPRPEIDPDEIYVGSCATSVPVLLPDGDVAAAVLTVALGAGSDVLAYRVDDEPSVFAVVETIARCVDHSTPGAPGRRLIAQLKRSPERTRLERALRAAGLAEAVSRQPPRSPRGSMAHLLGGRLGTVRLHEPSTRRSRLKRVLANQAARPLALDDARSLIDAEVAKHQSTIPARVDRFMLGPIGAGPVLLAAWANIRTARRRT